jgi:hypothetical protein
MRRQAVDMRIIVSREYNDDPVFRSMAPLTSYSSGGARSELLIVAAGVVRCRSPLH